MTSFRNYTDLLISLNHARKAVGVGFFAEAVKSNLKLEIVEHLPKVTTLVLSPHPDDDVFGCGGTIKLLLSGTDKVKVKVIYFCNGFGGRDSQSDIPPDQLISLREEEARSAALLLGVSDVEFLNIPDGKLDVNNFLADKLRQKIEDFGCDLILSPAIIDPHPDHSKTAELLAAALFESKFSGQIWQYEVWQPLFANRLVQIDEVIELKKEAIIAHRSQITDRGYLEAILGLNRYRAGMFNAGNFAEAFFASNKEIYLKLAKQSRSAS